MATSIENIAPGLTDRVVLVGQTGSGKTTLARYLLSLRKYVVIYDAKGLITWPEYQRHTTLSTLIKSRYARLLYAPTFQELENQDYREKFFRWVYERKNTSLYIDEVYAVTDYQRDYIPRYYHAILTRGRERGISTYNATQRPSRIPQVILSETEHYYLFRLLLPQDRKRMEEVSGIDDDKLRLHKQDFYYKSVDADEAIGPLKLDLEGKYNGATNAA